MHFPLSRLSSAARHPTHVLWYLHGEAYPSVLFFNCPLRCGLVLWTNSTSEYTRMELYITMEYLCRHVFAIQWFLWCGTLFPPYTSFQKCNVLLWAQYISLVLCISMLYFDVNGAIINYIYKIVLSRYMMQIRSFEFFNSCLVNVQLRPDICLCFERE